MKFEAISHFYYGINSRFKLKRLYEILFVIFVAAEKLEFVGLFVSQVIRVDLFQIERFLVVKLLGKPDIGSLSHELKPFLFIFFIAKDYIDRLFRKVGRPLIE